MIATELKSIAEQVDLDNAGNSLLRVCFGVACAERVETFLTDATIIEALQVGKRCAGISVDGELQKAAKICAAACRSHRGSNSFDGAGNAAVSASYAVAAALSGRALEAAGYTAYAAVYAYSSSSVTDVSAYRDEHNWQINTLKTLLKAHAELTK